MIAFDALIAAHIVTGATGLGAMWVPVLSRKGSAAHKLWGRVFVFAMLATGGIAVGISICSLVAPLETHPWSDDATLIRGVFGWMMMYLGILTVALTWHSYVAVRHKTDRGKYATPFSFGVQAAMGAAAIFTALYGFSIGNYLMVGVAVPGFAAAIINTVYLADRAPIRQEWLVQHYRCGIGAGISVYTAFFAFGAVNAMPALAFNPVLWATPTVLGVGYMIHHQLQTTRQRVRWGHAHEMRFGRYIVPYLTDKKTTETRGLAERSEKAHVRN